jgi:signal transduction histidine kinase
MTSMFFGSALIGRVISDLRNSEESIMEQKVKLEDSNARLRKANQEMDRFVYSVSHDITAPLKSIRGLISIGKLENRSNEFPYIDKIEQSVKRLEDFSEEILAHSRASRKEMKYEQIDLQEFTNEIIESLRYLDGFGAINFTFQFQASTVISDRFLLKVVLSNLISNAIKFQRKAEGHAAIVSIKSYTSRDQLFIEVKDNGYGIEEEYKLRIFEMFYRATDLASGSGLGLFIAKEAVEKLNGGITLQTKNGEGSLFTIHLPLLVK